MLDIIGAAKKAAPVFEENGWTYGWTHKGGAAIPEWWELADTIRELAEHVEEDRQEQGDTFVRSHWSSGRFIVECTRFGDEDQDEITVSLELSDDYLDREEELFS